MKFQIPKNKLQINPKFQIAILCLVLGVLILPQVISAQVIIDKNAPVPVPTAFPACPPIIGFFFGCAPAGASTASQLILGIISIALAIVGLLSVLFVIVGGFRYVTASGNEEQAEGAKKTITHAIIGVVIVILSFVIVRVISNALIFGSGRFGT